MTIVSMQKDKGNIYDIKEFVISNPKRTMCCALTCTNVVTTIDLFFHSECTTSALMFLHQ